MVVLDNNLPCHPPDQTVMNVIMLSTGGQGQSKLQIYSRNWLAKQSPKYCYFIRENNKSYE